MLKKIATLGAIAIALFFYYQYFIHEDPSFPTIIEDKLLGFLNESCTKSELGLEEGVEDWKLVEAWPAKKPPAWEKEQVYTRTVHLKGWYLPEGKTGKTNYLRFKAKLNVEINATEPKAPIFKQVN